MSISVAHIINSNSNCISLACTYDPWHVPSATLRPQTAHAYACAEAESQCCQTHQSLGGTERAGSWRSRGEDIQGMVGNSS